MHEEHNGLLFLHRCRNRILKYKSKLLNDEYSVNYGIKDYLGKGAIFSFKTSCYIQSIDFEENIQGVIVIPQFRRPASCHSLIGNKPGLH